MWPVELALEFMEWQADARLPGWSVMPRSDDSIVGFWARKRWRERQFWATVPCLVEHPDVVPSTIRRPGRVPPNRGRTAIQFVSGDAREIDWSV